MIDRLVGSTERRNFCHDLTMHELLSKSLERELLSEIIIVSYK